MAEKNKPDPTTAEESDISKAQSQQQPPQQARQQPETGEQGSFEEVGGQAANDQGQAGAGPDEGLQGETATEQRADIEGTSTQSEEGEADSGFVGSKGDEDSSSELVEDQDFDEGGESAPEGK